MSPEMDRYASQGRATTDEWNEQIHQRIVRKRKVSQFEVFAYMHSSFVYSNLDAPYSAHLEWNVLWRMEMVFQVCFSLQNLSYRFISRRNPAYRRTWAQRYQENSEYS